MNQSGIDAIALGPAYGWNHWQGRIDYSEAAAHSYRVLSLPSDADAGIHCAAPGEWYFQFRDFDIVYSSAPDFKTKEIAMAELRLWLTKRFVRYD
jgi:hypothetical protein